MKGRGPTGGNPSLGKERGLVLREAGGRRASSPTAGPSFPGGACAVRPRYSGAAGCTERPRGSAWPDGGVGVAGAREFWTGDGPWLRARENRNGRRRRQGGGERATGPGFRAGRPPDCWLAGPAAPPPASGSRAPPHRDTWRVDVVISSPGSAPHPAALLAASVRPLGAELLRRAQGARRLGAGRGQGGRSQPEQSRRASEERGPERSGLSRATAPRRPRLALQAPLPEAQGRPGLGPGRGWAGGVLGAGSSAEARMGWGGREVGAARAGPEAGHLETSSPQVLDPISSKIAPVEQFFLHSKPNSQSFGFLMFNRVY